MLEVNEMVEFLSVSKKNNLFNSLEGIRSSVGAVFAQAMVVRKAKGNRVGHERRPSARLFLGSCGLVRPILVVLYQGRSFFLEPLLVGLILLPGPRSRSSLLQGRYANS